MVAYERAFFIQQLFCGNGVVKIVFEFFDWQGNISELKYCKNGGVYHTFLLDENQANYLKLLIVYIWMEFSCSKT